MKDSSSLRLRPWAWRCQTSRISSPFDVTEMSKRFHVAESSRVARIMVVKQSTMLLRRMTARQDSSRLASPQSSPEGRENAVTLSSMTGCLDRLCSQEQRLYPYGHEENDI